METKKMSKLSMVLIVIGLGLCGSCTGNFINPILQKLIEMFPHLEPTTVRLLASYPGLISLIISIPLSLFWGNKVKFKTLMIVDAALVCCGMIPFFFKELTFGVLMFSRICLGVAFGLNAMRNAVIRKVFGSTGNVAAWLGYNNMVFNVSNIVAPTISGLLGDINVRYTFAMYAVGVVALFINTFILEVPNDGQLDPSEVSETTSKESFKVAPKVFIYTAIIAFVTVVSFTINTGMSTYVVEKGFGEAAVAGTVSSAYSIGCLLGSMSTGWWHKRVPSRFYLAIDMGFCALGFGLVVIAPSIWFVRLGALLLGIGFTYNYLMNINWAGDVAYATSRSFSLTLTTIGLNLGAYCSAYWMKLCGALSGIFSFLKSDAGRSYAASALVYVLFMIIFIAWDPRPQSVKEKAKAAK